jgi:phosphohistidine phosphatase
VVDVERLRRLIVLRHAKSARPDVPDHERPLAGRGRRDAPAAGRWLRDSGCAPDRVICSTARRARETWELVDGELGVVHPSVEYDPRVYDATVPELLEVVHELPDDAVTVLLVGHNPGFEELTMALAGSADGDALDRARAKFPTCAIAVLAFTGPWTALAAGAARLTHFAAPRG